MGTVSWETEFCCRSCFPFVPLQVSNAASKTWNDPPILRSFLRSQMRLVVFGGRIMRAMGHRSKESSTWAQLLMFKNTFSCYWKRIFSSFSGPGVRGPWSHDLKAEVFLCRVGLQESGSLPNRSAAATWAKQVKSFMFWLMISFLVPKELQSLGNLSG